MTTEALVKAYKDAQTEILQSIREKADLGQPYDYELALFTDIRRALSDLGEYSIEWVQTEVPEVYEAARIKTHKQLSLEQEADIAFSGLNRQAVNEIIENTAAGFNQALITVGRRVNGQIREAGIRAVQKGFTLNRAVQEIARDLEETLAQQGCVFGVPDSRGHIMPVDSYADMVARTTTRETTNTATINTAHGLNVHLYAMSEHYPTCKICAPRQGRVYRDADYPAGDDRNRFPHISNAFSNWPTYKTVHPNCRHVISAVGWNALSLSTQQAMLAEAAKPFDIDPRCEKEIQAYNAGQDRMRHIRDDRKQWRRYQAVLGEDAPKTFAAFRRMKTADSEKWRLVQTDYRRRNALIHDSSKALPNFEGVVAEDKKFTHYFFGGNRPEGTSKGVAFSSHLGYNSSNWKDMQEDIISRAALYPAVHTETTVYGEKYNQRMVLYGPKNNPMSILVAWEVRGEFTRMITAHPSDEKE